MSSRVVGKDLAIVSTTVENALNCSDGGTVTVECGATPAVYLAVLDGGGVSLAKTRRLRRFARSAPDMISRHGPWSRSGGDAARRWTSARIVNRLTVGAAESPPFHDRALQSPNRDLHEAPSRV
jgi:hypothetical protein